MRTARPNPTTRQTAHGALLGLALLAGVGLGRLGRPPDHPAQGGLQATDHRSPHPT